MKKYLIRAVELALVLCILFSAYKIFDYYHSNQSFQADQAEFVQAMEKAEAASPAATPPENPAEPPAKEEAPTLPLPAKSAEAKSEETASAPASETREAAREEAPAPAAEKARTEAAPASSKNAIRSLKDRYPNVVGRIRVPSTAVDFPVVQGEDNAFYLDHNYKGEYHPFGAVFMDARDAADFSDYNTVLYGHNVRSGHVFHELVQYGDEEFRAAHPLIYVDTPRGQMAYRVVAAYDVSAYADYRKPQYSGEDKARFLSRIDAENLLPYTMPRNGKILTLSTCSDRDDRMVIHAVRTES